MTSDATDTGKPRTIVLVHGLWMTPLSWEKWIDRFTSRGYRVIAPAWPGMNDDIEEFRRDPSAIAGMGVTEIVDHYDSIIRELDAPPIIIGHSFGGLVTEMLLDRGLGAVGVAIAPAPAKGVFRLPFSALRAASPVLRNPLNRKRAVPLTAKQFRYAFGNTLTQEQSDAAYRRYAVAGPGRVLFQAAFANLNPRAATRINFRNEKRPPLLILGGGKDHTVPAALAKEAATRERKAKSLTVYKEWPDRIHFTVGQQGWEEVADFALEWAAEHATAGASVREQSVDGLPAPTVTGA